MNTALDTLLRKRKNDIRESEEKIMRNMIKNGMTTKEIYQALNVSTNAINIYHQKIRIKMGSNREKINLRSFLISLGKK